jgi:hypothetical protein
MISLREGARSNARYEIALYVRQDLVGKGASV